MQVTVVAVAVVAVLVPVLPPWDVQVHAGPAGHAVHAGFLVKHLKIPRH